MMVDGITGQIRQGTLCRCPNCGDRLDPMDVYPGGAACMECGWFLSLLREASA